MVGRAPVRFLGRAGAVSISDTAGRGRYRCPVSSSAWFLVVSIVGATFTIVALAATRAAPTWLVAFSFFAAWLTGARRVHLAWQARGDRGVRRARCARRVAGLGRARDHAGVVGGTVRPIVGRRDDRARRFEVALDAGRSARMPRRVAAVAAQQPRALPRRRLLRPFSFATGASSGCGNIRYVDADAGRGTGSTSTGRATRDRARRCCSRSTAAAG